MNLDDSALIRAGDAGKVLASLEGIGAQAAAGARGAAAASWGPAFERPERSSSPGWGARPSAPGLARGPPRAVAPGAVRRSPRQRRSLLGLGSGPSSSSRATPAAPRRPSRSPARRSRGRPSRSGSRPAAASRRGWGPRADPWFGSIPGRIPRPSRGSAWRAPSSRSWGSSSAPMPRPRSSPSTARCATSWPHRAASSRARRAATGSPSTARRTRRRRSPPSSRTARAPWSRRVTWPGRRG